MTPHTFRNEMSQSTTQFAQNVSAVLNALDATNINEQPEAARLVCERMDDLTDRIELAWSDIRSAERDLREPLDALCEATAGDVLNTRIIGYMPNTVGRLVSATATLERAQQEFRSLFAIGRSLGIW